MIMLRSLALGACLFAGAVAQGDAAVGADGSLSMSDQNACPNRVNSHLDAGFSGITEEECGERGACWDPSSPASWCYPLGERMRTIVLYSADGAINTGVWSEFGGSPPVRSELRWGNKGVVVEKSCPVSCHFTADQERLREADAVLIETVRAACPPLPPPSSPSHPSCAPLSAQPPPPPPPPPLPCRR